MPATASLDGMPNVIYAASVGLYGEGRVVVADNSFDRTRKNILSGSKAAVLFMAKDRKACQL